MILIPRSINPVVHAPIRLAVLVLLAEHGPRDFATLKERLTVTDGALGSHLKKLLAAGYLTFQKEFITGKPRTCYELSDAGRTALHDYRAQIVQLLGAGPTAAAIVQGRAAA